MKYTSLVLGAALLLVGPAAHADSNWPTKPIRILVPYTAGGGTDTTIRVLSLKASRILGQPIVVENKPGGATITATQTVVTAPADGYTIGAAAAPLTLNPALGIKTPYDGMRDLVHVIRLVDLPTCLFVNPGHPARNFREFVEWAKAQKEPVLYAAAGVGSLPHLWMEYLGSKLGFKVEHVGYTGSTQVITDVIAGNISVGVGGYAPSCARSTTGEVRALGLAWSKRLAVLPDVPTFRELGFDVADGAANFGIIAPKNTPGEVVSKINSAYNEALRDPEARKTLEGEGLLAAGGSPDDYKKFLQGELQRWKTVVAENGIKLKQ